MKNQKQFIFFFILCSVALCASAQEERWEAYMAKYSKGPGSVTTNFGLLNFKDAAQYPFLLIAGVRYANCTAEGFPAHDELGVLDKMSDTIAAVIGNYTKTIFAGTFTYQCERLNYFYVADTSGIRNKLAKLVNKDYRAYKFSVTARPDKDWDTFNRFLYPNDQTLEIIENGKMVSALHKAGDNLNKPRKVEHWLYFKTAQGRTDFLPYASYENFKVEDSIVNKVKEGYPFPLHISRIDLVDVNSISKVTIALRKQSKKLEGIYDGWECVVIKE